MKPYVLALGAGVLIGLIYHLLKVRSPAPPLVALVGLFGILLGEQALPLAQVFFHKGGNRLADCRAAITGLPQNADTKTQTVEE